MGKTITSSSSKAKKSTASSAKRSITKKALVSSTKKSAPNKKVSITTSKKSKKNKKNDAPPLPKGWPASSKLTYPTPRDVISVNNKDTNTSSDSSMNLLSDSDEDKSPSPSIPANYLTPGNILQQACNGSDVQLKKRAVQSTSMMFPNPNSKSSNGPTRFLIVFPGRMSLKVPPVVAKKDDDMKDDTTDDNEDEEDKPKKKKNPFTPTNPPQLLGKLISLGGSNNNMELRIPFPSSSSDDSNDVNKKE